MFNAQETSRLKALQAKIDAAKLGGAAVELTDDDERFLNAIALNRSKQNIRNKAISGKTLTAREQAVLSAGALETEGSALTFVQNWNELADAIPIDRRTLQNFRDDNAQLIEQQKKDLFRSDGRKNVPAWRDLLAECGVKGRGANNPDVGSLDARQLELEERRFKLEKAKFELDKAKKLQLPIADFEAALGPALVQFRSSLNALPGRGAGKILSRARTAILNMLRAQLTEKQFEIVDRAMNDAKTSSVEYFDIEQTLQAEVDLVLRTLERCNYLQVTDES